MKDVEIKDERGEHLTTISVPNKVDYERRYREACEHQARLSACLNVLTDIVRQQKAMKMSPSVSLLAILAEISDADIEATDVLLKPMIKACRKAIAKSTNRREGYMKLARNAMG